MKIIHKTKHHVCGRCWSLKHTIFYDRTGWREGSISWNHKVHFSGCWRVGNAVSVVYSIHSLLYNDFSELP